MGDQANRPRYGDVEPGTARRFRCVAFWIAGLALALSAGASIADPWKDESGKVKWRGGGYGGYERHGGYGGWDGPRDRKVKMRMACGCEVERKWKKGASRMSSRSSGGRTADPAVSPYVAAISTGRRSTVLSGATT